jgi:hypothetical protein
MCRRTEEKVPITLLQAEEAVFTKVQAPRKTVQEMPSSSLPQVEELESNEYVEGDHDEWKEGLELNYQAKVSH